MVPVPRRRVLRTPLGLWLEDNIRASPFKTKDAFRTAVGVQQSTFNDWQRIDRASVPEGATVALIAEVLKLTPEKQAELNQVLVAQEEVRRDASAVGRSVGALIRTLRESTGLTQAQLAERAGIQREHLSNIETGKNKLTGTAARDGLARALGMTVEDFAKLADSPPPDHPKFERNANGEIVRSAPAQRSSPTDEGVTPSVAVSMGADGCTIEVRCELGVILMTPRLARVFAKLVLKACDVASPEAQIERRNDGC